MLKIKKDSKIYIVSPAYHKTGGTELLHQFSDKLYKLNFKNVYIIYYDKKNDGKEYMPKDFKKYKTKELNINNIEYSKNNFIIFPELYVEESMKFKNDINKIIWWLSVDNAWNFYGIFGLKFFLKINGFLKTIKAVLKKRIKSQKKLKEFDYHLCQSYYAIDYLHRQNIRDNVESLSDYINTTYIDLNYDSRLKEDIVLYNPKKGFKFTKKIMDRGLNFNWIPIQNLTTEQVKNLLLKSKVYIDFGNHPGKDRFPREAAMCGCCVITGKRGSAKFYKDVPIPDEFKFEDKNEKIDDIIGQIKNCLDNYEIQSEKFDDYRKFIKNEEKKFEEDIKKIFEVSD